jgi:hypothetical protein
MRSINKPYFETVPESSGYDLFAFSAGELAFYGEHYDFDQLKKTCA